MLLPLKKYLEEKGLEQSKIGLTSIAHLRDCYNLYYSKIFNYSGVVKKDDANYVSLSDIAKEEKLRAMLYFNKGAYSIYCKQFKKWDWIAMRNEQRYNTRQKCAANYSG